MKLEPIFTLKLKPSIEVQTFHTILNFRTNMPILLSIREIAIFAFYCLGVLQSTEAALLLFTRTSLVSLRSLKSTYLKRNLISQLTW